ncbi:MAG: hypothetical protein P1P83_02145 [Bacteroidales bacterium]|nr:hypothetical protein [Bacteroidales bacterium]MDT8373112.1 hypothetical protein [Bacteroidales bacterium]
MKNFIYSKPLSSGNLRLNRSLVIMMLSAILFPAALPGQTKDDFKPSGKAEVRIFTGFNTTFSDGEMHSKFDVTRAYLGYSYNFTRTLSGRVVYDVADPSAGNLKFTGMLKFAYLRYKTEKWTVTGGMIPLPQYAHADKTWGYRYIYKPSHDVYGFGTAADLGLSVVHRIAPWITADVTLINGEGYKLTEADSTFKAAAGITLLPVRNVSLRGYVDNMSKDGINQQTAEVFVSWEERGYLLSAAFHYRKSHKLIDGHDYRALTLNSRLPVSERVAILGRYDYVASVKIGSAEEPWNLAKDGQFFLGGIEFAISPGVRLSPNFQGWKPADNNLPFISTISLSLDLKI